MKLFFLSVAYAQVAFATFFACCLAKEVPAVQTMEALNSLAFLTLCGGYSIHAFTCAFSTEG